jgi:hypothetical protein
MPGIPPWAPAPLEQQADAVAEIQRLVAERLETPGPLHSWYVPRDLLEDERRQIRGKLATLILAIATDVFHPTEKAKARSLVRLVTVVYVLLALYSAVARAIDAVEAEDE